MYRLLTTLYTSLCLCCLATNPTAAQAPIGQWQEYLSWLPAVAVTMKTDKIYCATSQGLFAVTTGAEQDITRYSKVNGLHDIGISTIASNDNSVLIAYQNSNIDLLRGNNSYNIPDLLRKQVAADKSIFRISYYNNNAYLCTGLGIVVVNTSIPEIAATYVTGSNGTYTPVYAVAIQGSVIYAATAEGIRSTNLTGNNPADFRNWSSIQQGLLPDTVQQVINYNNQLICRQGKQLYQLQNNSWHPWYTDGWDISNMEVQAGQLRLCEQQAGNARIIVLRADGTPQAILQHPYIATPLQTAGDEQEIWIADALHGLIRYDGDYAAIHPNTPASVITGQLLFVNSTLWATAGGVSNTWKANGNRNGYYTFNQGEWQQFTHADSLKDLLPLVAAPAGNGVFAGSFGGGLLHIAADGSHKIYKQGILPPSSSDAQAYNVSGLTTDAAGNVWVAIYGASANLLVKKPDNTWLSFRSPFAQSGNAISQLLADDFGQIYMVSPQSNGLYVLNHANTLNNTQDDQWRQFRLGPTQGNLPSNDVYCMAKDRNGSIWVGTARGIAVINCGAQSTADNCAAWLPIIKQDNFAGYLFQQEQVNTIAVDGANRKWVGTLNGVWLVSEDGERILAQFNTANSPLPDNYIYNIAIHPVTGEVYFATGKGLMSWRGTATEPATMRKNDVLVFPNPVPSRYQGMIAIRGLVENALVKITDISGRMVFQTRALGGQAVWNGVDYTGHRPQSGVYLVFAAGATGGEHLVTKILFVN
jgi:hypothetical protein